MDSRIIFVIEDDIRLAKLIKAYFEQHEFVVVCENRGDLAVERLKSYVPDLVLLDLMLPGKDGLSVLREIRPGFTGPILILTAREDDSDQILGLEMGADDYIKKPVDPEVLLARIRAIFRQQDRFYKESETQKEQGGIQTFGELAIDHLSRTATLAGNPVDLSTLEFDLLKMLASEPGTVMSRDRLYLSVRGIEYDGLDRSIDVAISRLRKKLEDNPEKPFRIKTIWGSGYLFVEDVWRKET